MRLEGIVLVTFIKVNPTFGYDQIIMSHTNVLLKNMATPERHKNIVKLNDLIFILNGEISSWDLKV